MMISKFHKLIQSKTVWYIVLGVIVIAFVGFFTPTMGNRSAKESKQYAGEMFGEKVPREDFRRAFRANYIWYILSTGQQPDTREMGDALMQQAWQHLVLLHKAEEEQVMVSDQEVVGQIQRMPIFMNQQGVFDPAAYNAILGQIGTSSSQIENIVREQLAIQKMRFRPVQAALIAPEELERAYHLYSDRLVLNYALITDDMLDVDAAVSSEEAEAYYNANREMFRMPAKVRVSYVEYPTADFMDQAEVPEGAALQFYNQNLEAFQVETTGDVAGVEYKPFEEVEPEIIENIKQFSARRLAVEAATSLVADIAPKAQDAQPDFQGAVAAAGLTAQALPTFGPSDQLSEIDPTAPFKQAALG
ncbi:MAG TPA: SurA N-terminal domain-containing protein, partial [Tichowtungia sp.]|nr:SurA N-terminal domain-containing protein [Tichowtungia sp.]